VFGDEESTLGDDTSENTTTKNHQRVLILLSIGERFVFFFLLGAERGDDCEVAERMTSERIWGDFFAIDRKNMGRFIKSQLTP